MLNKQQVMALIKTINDTTINKTLAETNGVREIKADKQSDHVGLKIAIGKVNTSEQAQIETEIVNKLKRVGVKTVDVSFESLTEEEIKKIRLANNDTKTILSNKEKTKIIAIISGKGGEIGRATC